MEFLVSSWCSILCFSQLQLAFFEDYANIFLCFSRCWHLIIHADNVNLFTICMVSILVCEQAYSMAQNLDPNSDGRGVLQFKTGLMSVIKV